MQTGLGAQIGEMPRPWGFWSTAGWALSAFVLAAVAVIGGILWRNSGRLDLTSALMDATSLSLQVVISNLVLILVLAFAARLSGWPVARYLALTIPRVRDFVYGISSVALLLSALEILNYLLGRESVTPFQTESYGAAHAAGLLPLMWLAFVVAAPLGEEITFRGFLFRGWAASRPGVTGTILLTALTFAAVHGQYDWFDALQVFCLGALFGWLRWRSCSTTLTIVLHMMVNLLATSLAAAKVHGLL
ncbi:MAG: CPBP family intramembrane glutamic endopeptidase [Xanthobacteraceae bacterium]